MAWYPRRIFQWLANGLQNPEVGVQQSSPSLGAEAASVTDDRAIQVSVVWSCVRLIAESVACLPLNFYEKGDGGRTILDDDHRLVRMLKYKPNQVMTDVEFREAMTTQLVLWGNAYALKAYDSGNTVISLMPLSPGKMDVVRMPDNSVEYHYYTDDEIIKYKQSDIFHLKGFSSEGLIGYSVLGMARQSLGMTVAAEQYSAGAFRNGGRPLGTLEFDKVLTPEQRAGAHKVFEDITGGALNNARSWVLEGGAKYNPISIPPDDLQMLESRQFQLGEIARFFRVPSHLINDSEKSTSWGSGLEQLDLAFLKYTLTPYLRRWETTIRNSLMSPQESRKLTVEHSVEGLLRADSKARAEFYSKMAQNAIMSRDEIREKENLPRRGGNAAELTAQVNLVPIDKLGEVEPEPEPEFDEEEADKYFKRLSEVYAAAGAAGSSRAEG